MPKSSTKAKQKWNKAHYSQIKVSVPHELAAVYKARCKTAGVSIAADLITHMSYEPPATRLKHVAQFPVGTREQRRKTTGKIIVLLTAILDAEDEYLNNIPKNLQGGERYSMAKQTVETLSSILDLAEDIY
jgi:hypothetical protein